MKTTVYNILFVIKYDTGALKHKLPFMFEITHPSLQFVFLLLILNLSINGFLLLVFFSLFAVSMFEDVPFSALCLVSEEQQRERSHIEEFVRSGSFEDYTLNPAYCDSRFSQHSDGAPLKWTPPGKGEKAKNDRFVSHIEICEDGKHKHIIKNHCWKMSCPECCYDQMDRLSRKLTDKVTGCRRAILNEGSGRASFQHLVISLPESYYSSCFDYKLYMNIRKRVSAICEEIGLVGGAMFFHGWRQDGVDDDKVDADYVPSPSNTLDNNHWRWSPHFHVVGFGFIKPCSKEFIASHNGFLYSALRTGENKIRDENEIFGIVRYLLTHVSLCASEDHQRMKSYSYLGMCNSRNSVKVAEVVLTSFKTCEDGHLIHDYIDGDGLAFDLGIHVESRAYGVFCSPKNKQRTINFVKSYHKDPCGFLELIEDEQLTYSYCSLSHRDLCDFLKSDPGGYPRTAYLKLTKKPDR